MACPHLLDVVHLLRLTYKSPAHLSTLSLMIPGLLRWLPHPPYTMPPTSIPVQMHFYCDGKQRLTQCSPHLIAKASSVLGQMPHVSLRSPPRRPPHPHADWALPFAVWHLLFVSVPPTSHLARLSALRSGTLICVCFWHLKECLLHSRC